MNVSTGIWAQKTISNKARCAHMEDWSGSVGQLVELVNVESDKGRKGEERNVHSLSGGIPRNLHLFSQENHKVLNRGDGQIQEGVKGGRCSIGD